MSGANICVLLILVVPWVLMFVSFIVDDFRDPWEESPWDAPKPPKPPKINIPKAWIKR